MRLRRLRIQSDSVRSATAPTWRSADRLGDELASLVRHADVQTLDAERLRDLDARQLGQALPGDSPREARHEPAVGDRVISRARRGRRYRALRQLVLETDVVEQVFGLAGHGAHARQSGPMRQEVPDGHARLAPGGELGPIGGDWLVVVQLTAVGQSVDDRGGHALGGREADRERVGRPWPGAVAVGVAGPEVHDRLPAQAHGQRSATTGTVHQALERARNGLEPGCRLSSVRQGGESTGGCDSP